MSYSRLQLRTPAAKNGRIHQFPLCPSRIPAPISWLEQHFKETREIDPFLSTRNSSDFSSPALFHSCRAMRIDRQGLNERRTISLDYWRGCMTPTNIRLLRCVYSTRTETFRVTMAAGIPPQSHNPQRCFQSPSLGYVGQVNG